MQFGLCNLLLHHSRIDALAAPMSRRLYVVAQTPPLLREVGRNGETSFPRGLTNRSLQHLEFISFFYLAASDRSQLEGDSLHFLRPESILLPSPFSRLLILLILLVSGNVHPTPALPLFAQQTPNIHAASALVGLGEPPFSVAAARGGSTPPAPGTLDSTFE